MESFVYCYPERCNFLKMLLSDSLLRFDIYLVPAQSMGMSKQDFDKQVITVIHQTISIADKRIFIKDFMHLILKAFLLCSDTKIPHAVSGVRGHTEYRKGFIFENG